MMIRVICFIMVLFGYLSNSDAHNLLTGSLFGYITDSRSHKPVEGATLHIPDLKQWAVTDSSGFYRFSNLPNGSFAVEISNVGYRSQVNYTTIAGAIRRDFVLAPSVVEIVNVTVTGVATATQIKRSPLQVSIVSKKELDRSSGANLLDALNKEPGFSMVTTGPAIAKPFIRGLGYNRVVTVNDGIRQEGQQWGDEHGLELDEYSAQKVELVRGPASLMFGSDAIGGVINVLTNVPVPNNTVRANLSGSHFSNNSMVGGYANVAGNIQGFNWNIYTSVKSAGDYKNKFDGAVLNSRFGENNYGGYFGINKKWGYSHLLFSGFHQKLGMIEGVRDEKGQFVLDGYSITPALSSSRNPLVPFQQVYHRKLAWDNSVSLKNGARITALLGYQVNQRQEFGNEEQPKIPEIYFDLSTASYQFAYHLPYWNQWKTSLGISGMEQKNSNRGQKAIIPAYNLSDIGFYGYTTKSVNGTTWSGGLRYDFRKMSTEQLRDASGVMKFEALKRGFSNMSASIGAARELGRYITVKANLSKGFRAPNAPELAVNGEHEGTGRYETGNKDLKSENSFSVDGGLALETDHISMNLSPFYNYISNYIYYQKLPGAGGTDSLVDGAVAFKFAQQTARLHGLEFNIDLHPHPLDWLHVENTFSLTRGRFLKPVDGSCYLPLIAPARWITQLRAEFPNLSKGLKNTFFSVEMDLVATQDHFFSGYNTETATKGYTLFNASWGTDLARGNKKIAAVLFGLTNLTDVAYQSHLSRLKYLDENPLTGRRGAFNMGRNFVVRIIVPLEWKLKEHPF